MEIVLYLIRVKADNNKLYQNHLIVSEHFIHMVKTGFPTSFIRRQRCIVVSHLISQSCKGLGQVDDWKENKLNI